MTFQVSEGFMPFRSFRTYYRVVTPQRITRPALLLLHGGPGSTHNYFELLDELAATGRQVVMYDQLGCGESWVEPGHPELWTLPHWLDELEALRHFLHLERLHVLGQSWGGMMVLAWLIDRKPQGVQSAILSSTLSSSVLWGREQHRLLSLLPEEDQRAIAEAERTACFTAPEYLAANERYTHRHAYSVTPESPECVRRAKRFGTESYEVAWGPNEFTPWGNLKDFDYTPRLPEIKQPCLVISGTRDESTPLIAKTMADGIPNSQWWLMDGARHLTFADQPEAYRKRLAEWCEAHDD